MVSTDLKAARSAIPAGNETDCAARNDQKVLDRMIITKIMRAIEENNVLCSAQYGSRRHRSTASANLIFKNALEAAWENKTVVNGSSC